MIVKPAITYLTTDPDAILVTDTRGVLAAMTDNLNYSTPVPTLALVATACAAFETALADAAGGGVTLTAAKRARRAELVALMRQLASYVQVACEGDLEKLLSSGFPIQKPKRQPIEALLAPARLVVNLGPRTGSLLAKAEPVFGGSIYNWRYSTAAPDEWMSAGQTTAASKVFDDLTPGVIHNIQVNVVGAAGPSDWSNAVSHMVI